MFVARWQIDARFGEKEKAIDLLRKWMADIGPKVGLGDIRMELLTGSIGAREATIEVNHYFASLAVLETFFDALGKNAAHKKWSASLEPHVVSGTSFWQVFRLL